MKKFLIAVAVVILAAFAAPAFAATNPFMDVPASHWAYDAVAQLASRGVISGYPDGSYKGQQPATRYEMASLVARAMARIDMEKASKQDVEMLKKLIVEFKDELDALGVKVDRIDSRLAVLERDLGGWSISGQFRFDARFGDEGGYNTGKHDFDLNRYRIFLRKRINETTSFTARIGRGGSAGAGFNDYRNIRWERYYITTQLPWGISMTAGRSYHEWEVDLGLVTDNDAVVGAFHSDNFWFKKDWGMANLQLIIGRVYDNRGFPGGTTGVIAPEVESEFGIFNLEQFYVAGLANFNFTEQFRGGIMAYYFFADEEYYRGPNLGDTDTDLLTAGIYLGYAFTPSIELKGIYYFQDQGGSYARRGDINAVNAWLDDDASAWRVMLHVDQDALKFTSLKLEYGQMDNNFVRFSDTIPYSGYDPSGPDIIDGRPLNNNTTKIYGARADQQWNDKWRTYLRYFQADYDTRGLDDASNWTVGIGYRLNPAVEFELAYDYTDFGNNAYVGWEDDYAVRFRTFVTF